MGLPIGLFGTCCPFRSSSNEQSFWCHRKEPDGTPQFQAAVSRAIKCPNNAHEISGHDLPCECNDGFVAVGGACKPEDAAPSPAPRAAEPKKVDAKSIALGTEETDTGKSLTEFAQNTKSSHWKDWKKDGFTTLDPPERREKFAAYFDDAVARNAGKIKINFKLDDIFSKTDFSKLPQALLPAAKRPWSSGLVTKSELLEILKSRELLADTTFWLKSQPYKIAYDKIQANLEATLRAAGK